MPRFSLLLPLTLIGTMGCSQPSSTDAPDPHPCSDIAIDRFSELLIVDEDVVSDPRSSNADAGPWSFRHIAEQLAPDGMTASEMVHGWLTGWEVSHTVNLYQVAPRPKLRQAVLCPWLQATPDNECDVSCFSCTGTHLDLSVAPFRLLAFANRTDLRDTVKTLAAGEARMVFGMTEGAGDDPASVPQDMTVIFEFVQLATDGRDAQHWAEQWHALGQYESHDEGFKAALEVLMSSLTVRGAAPSGSALGQVRTNERTFDWQWQLREFSLNDKGLEVAGTFNTPDFTLRLSDELKHFLTQNREAVLAGSHVIPDALIGGKVDQGYAWDPDVPEDLRHAFAKETCNGCHQTEIDEVDFNFQISPHRYGIDKLSRFLNNPDDPATDDLARRESSMQRALCGL